MKTSNKLIFAALLLLLATLAWYDCLLKAAYVSGKYKDPYSGFVSLKNTGFDTVDLVSSTAANVKFIQGPFSVKIDSNSLGYVRIRQTGKQLQINAVFEGDYVSGRSPYVLVISCPKLSAVNADATYSSNGKLVTDTIVRDDWRMRQVLIDGFKQDSLQISQDYGSTVVLANNHIGSVSAQAGKSAGSGSKLVIMEGNQFQSANIDVFNNSRLLLNNSLITNLNYHLADSAKVIITGKAQNLLNHQKSN